MWFCSLWAKLAWAAEFHSPSPSPPPPPSSSFIPVYAPFNSPYSPLVAHDLHPFNGFIRSNFDRQRTCAVQFRTQSLSASDIFARMLSQTEFPSDFSGFTVLGNREFTNLNLFFKTDVHLPRALSFWQSRLDLQLWGECVPLASSWVYEPDWRLFFSNLSWEHGYRFSIAPDSLPRVWRQLGKDLIEGHLPMVVSAARLQDGLIIRSQVPLDSQHMVALQVSLGGAVGKLTRPLPFEKLE